MRPAGETDDFVADCLRRVRQHVPITDPILRKIEEEIRKEWGGEKTYIAKVGELGKQVMRYRDDRIFYEYTRGEHFNVLKNRWGVSIRRIQQIIKLRASKV